MTSHSFFSKTPEYSPKPAPAGAGRQPDSAVRGEDGDKPRKLRHSRDAAFNGITEGLAGTTEDLPVEDNSWRL